MLSAYFFTSQRHIDMPLFVGLCWLSAVSIALLALSNFLWRGRFWALSTLVVLCWTLAVSIAAFFAAGMLGDTVHMSDIIGLVGEIIVTASPPLWFAVMLRQPDIVRAFSPTRHMPNTSNQSLQPTAGRSDE